MQINVNTVCQSITVWKDAEQGELECIGANEDQVTAKLKREGD